MLVSLQASADKDAEYVAERARLNSEVARLQRDMAVPAEDAARPRNDTCACRPRRPRRQLSEQRTSEAALTIQLLPDYRPV